MPYAIYENNVLVGVCKAEDLENVRANLENSPEGKLLKNKFTNKVNADIDRLKAQRQNIKNRQTALNRMTLDMKGVEPQDRQPMVENLKSFKSVEYAKLDEDYRKLGDKLCDLNRQKLDNEKTGSVYSFKKVKLLKG